MTNPASMYRRRFLVPADIVLAIPSRGSCRIEWATSLKFLEPPVGYSYAVRIVTEEKVEDARNSSVLEARNLDAKYLMFIDDDTLIPNHGLRELVYQMENNPDWDLLSGVYVTKNIPPETLVFTEKSRGAS